VDYRSAVVWSKTALKSGLKWYWAVQGCSGLFWGQWVRPVTYAPRMVDRRLDELIRTFSAVLVLGPRAVGKTMTAWQHAQTVIYLGQEAEARVFRADPDVALRGLAEPILLDEWREVPGVLGAVKRAVDADPQPGRFMLTGSVYAELDAATWSGTGRLVRLTMWRLTGRERFGDPTTGSLFDRLADDGVEVFDGG